MTESVVESEMAASGEPRAGAPVRHSAVEVARALGLEHDPTPEQAAVIEAPMAPLLVVAGAGSGKTETMAARVVWLVANGLVAPEEVLGLTFTRKAASELSARVERRLQTLRQVGLWSPSAGAGSDPFAGRPTISTYHSYAGSIVGDYGLRVGVEPTVRLLTEAATWQLAFEAAIRFDGDVGDFDLGEASLTNATLTLAGELAEHLVSLDQVDSYLGAVVDALAAVPLAGRARGLPPGLKEAVPSLRARRVAVEVARRYAALKQSRDAMDFADQIALAARLAGEYPDIGEIERERFRVVLLDEFQDTSHAQLELLRSLFRGAAVTAVGDPHQSIYGWRGASATTLAAFQRAFGAEGDLVPALPLATSWRNSHSVLAVANAVAEPLRARLRVPVERLTARPSAPQGRVFAARYVTDREEAEGVATWLGARGAGAGPGGPSAAVLCRKRRQFRPMMESLEAQGIPYEVVGLGGLLLTPEVEDVVALLNVVQDPTRGDHLMRLLLGPLVRIGAADLDGLWTYARARQRIHRPQGAAPDHARDAADTATLAEVLDDLPGPDWRGPRGESVSAVALERLAAVAAVVRRVRAQSALALPELVHEAERGLGLDIEVAARPGYYLSAARAHLDAFVDVAAEFAASADRATLGAFLAWLEAAEEHERGLETRTADSAAGAVAIMTVHAAKGLEWDLVAVPGLVEAGFPTHNSTQTSARTGRWEIGAQTGKGWLGSVTGSGIPHALRGDRGALPDLDWRSLPDTAAAKQAFETYATAMGEHAMDEERRLAYVAVTRARDQLLLTCSVWGPQKSPRVTSRFLIDALERAGLVAADLHERAHQLDSGSVPLGSAGPLTVLAWAPMPSIEDSRKPESTVERTAVWPPAPGADHPVLRQRAEAAAALVCAPAPAATDGRIADDEIGVLVERILRQAQTDSVTVADSLVLEAISASNVVAAARSPEAYAASLRRPMPTAPNRAARRGTRFHAFVEQHYGRAAMLDWDELPGSADAGLRADEESELGAMKSHFLASEWADRTPIAIETDVETVLPTAHGPVSVRGRIDAVFAGEPSDHGEAGVTIVDWKSGRAGDAADLADRAIQLGVYALAWERIHGLPPGSADVAFYFAATGETVWPDPPDEARIIAVLDALAPRP